MFEKLLHALTSTTITANNGVTYTYDRPLFLPGKKKTKSVVTFLDGYSETRIYQKPGGPLLKTLAQNCVDGTVITTIYDNGDVSEKTTIAANGDRTFMIAGGSNQNGYQTTYYPNGKVRYEEHSNGVTDLEKILTPAGKAGGERHREIHDGKNFYDEHKNVGILHSTVEHVSSLNAQGVEIENYTNVNNKRRGLLVKRNNDGALIRKGVVDKQQKKTGLWIELDGDSSGLLYNVGYQKDNNNAGLQGLLTQDGKLIAVSLFGENDVSITLAQPEAVQEFAPYFEITGKNDKTGEWRLNSFAHLPEPEKIMPELVQKFTDAFEAQDDELFNTTKARSADKEGGKQPERTAPGTS